MKINGTPLALSSSMTNPRLRVLSLGGGVQSTVLALMSMDGRFGPPPDCAIFADTGWEPAGVYENLEWLGRELPFPIHVVKTGDGLLAAVKERRNASGGTFQVLPAYVNKGGRNTPGQRQCTSNYKIRPMAKKCREILDAVGKPLPKGTVEQWLGISTDEVTRQKPSRLQWVKFRWPLIEAGISRADCRRWFAKHHPNRKLAKSACVGCPYRSAYEWVSVRKSDPEMWAHTLEVDAVARTSGEFLHRRMKPLDEAVDEDEAAINSRRLLFPNDREGGWENECGGHCGI